MQEDIRITEVTVKHNWFIQFMVEKNGVKSIVNCLLKQKTNLPDNYFTDNLELITIPDPDKSITLLQKKPIRSTDCWGLMNAFNMKFIINPDKLLVKL